MNKLYRLLAVVLLITVPLTASYGLSTAAKAGIDYRFTLDVIRKVKVMVDNFPAENKTTQFDKIKALFQQAGQDLYGRDYSSSYEKFITTKKELIILLEIVSREYLERSKMILDSTSNDSFNVLINFGKSGPYVAYFMKPFDPLRDVKPYTENFTARDYHFFRDKETIERYLQTGYKKYRDAQKIFDNPEIKLLRSRKKMSSSSMDFIIQSYINVIKLCRESKQYGIEIHKLMRIHETGDILLRYNISGDQLVPIYDDRIPKEFKVDAVDNQELLYRVEEKRLKK